MNHTIKRVLRALFKRVRLFGFNRYCPACGRFARTFGEYGLVPRPDAKCPFCGALERHRLVWLFLQRKTSLLSGGFTGRLLHIAPEEVFERKLRPLLAARYVTADLLSPSADVKLDVTDIPFSEQSFEAIICNHVLEHVPDDRKAMREFYRVLSDTGWAIFMVPITAEKTFEDFSVDSPEERLRIFGQADHVRNYGPDFVDRVRDAGFEVKQIKGGEFLSKEEMQKYAIRPDHVIYQCTTGRGAGADRVSSLPKNL